VNRRDFIKYGTVLASAGGIFFFYKNGQIFVKDIAEKKTDADIRPCKRPFECLEIHSNGKTYPCCPDFLKGQVAAGNIETQKFDEIWNGKMLTELRKKMKKGDFSMCNRELCCMYDPYFDFNIPRGYEKGPKDIKISYDMECNYKCIICRDEIKINTPEEMALYDKVYLPNVLEIAKNAETITLLGVGEPLFSRHAKHLMQELIKKYPKIRFNLCTNGFFLDEKNLTEIGIQNNIRGAFVSIDAIKDETYSKIRHPDAFNRVIKNLELMSEWKKQGKIEMIMINFVVHLLNYEELPDFVKFAQKIDATALITRYSPWPISEFHKRYDEVAVFEPTNKHYKDFVRIMHNPVFKDKKHCILEPKLFEIANS